MKRHALVCEQCNTPFEGKYKAMKFCSRECFFASRRGSAFGEKAAAKEAREQARQEFLDKQPEGWLKAGAVIKDGIYVLPPEASGRRPAAEKTRQGKKRGKPPGRKCTLVWQMVQRGQTFEHIANHYKMSVEEVISEYEQAKARRRELRDLRMTRSLVTGDE